MRLASVTLQAPAEAFEELPAFYGASLGLPGAVSDHVASFRIGASELRFEVAAPGDAPFYHFALLVPGDRFAAALSWARERVELLEIGDSGESVIHFESWNADSCYFHDPAANILELIAHRGFGASGAEGPFGGRELLGLSEIGLVGDVAALRADLEAVGLGVAPSFGPLTFMIEPTATLILAAPDYGWLPRGRPAEPWPVGVEVVEENGAGAAVASGAHHVAVLSPQAEGHSSP